MKKRIVFTVLFSLISIIQLYAQESINYCGFEKIENIKEIEITKIDFDNPQEKSSISLNETQKQEFINRLKISKNFKYVKVLLTYEVSVSYNNDEKEICYINGRILKKQDGTTYKLDNNMTLFLDSLFSKEDSSKKYKENIIETTAGRIHVYQTNYSRNDLKHIEGVTSNVNPQGVYDLTWKIGQELIDAQNSFLKKKYLKNYVERENLQKIADSYINEILKLDIPLFYSYYELHPIDEKQEKWIIYFVYVTKEHIGKKKYWDEVVFMMPDGTIVISNNNYENIKFKKNHITKLQSRQRSNRIAVQAVVMLTGTEPF